MINQTIPIKGKQKEGVCLTCSGIFKYWISSNKKYCSEKCYHRGQIGSKRPSHSKFMKEFYKTHEPPKGRLGKKYNEEEKINISNRMKKAWENPASKLNSKEYRQTLSDNFVKLGKMGKLNTGYARGLQGTYNINGKRKIFFRSSWEANYALYLDFLIKNGEIKSWEFEKDTFWFEKIKRGVRSYKPDFKVITNKDATEYHEVKGWMDAKSKTKLKRMAKYYPKIKMILIDASVYKDIKKKLGKALNFF